MRVTPPMVLWSCGLGPVLTVERGFQRRSLKKFCGEFMILGGYRCGLFPDADHTMGAGRRGAGNAERGRKLSRL